MAQRISIGLRRYASVSFPHVRTSSFTATFQPLVHGGVRVALPAPPSFPLPCTCFFFSRRLISSSSSSIFLTQRAVVENIAPYLRLTLADICACEIHVLKVLVGDSGVCDASDFSHSLTLALSAWLFFRGWFREREKKLPDHYLPFHSM